VGTIKQVLQLKPQGQAKYPLNVLTKHAQV
jgi:hypothetical protein